MKVKYQTYSDSQNRPSLNPTVKNVTRGKEMPPLNDVQATAFVTSLAITPVNIRRAIFEPVAIAMGVLAGEMDDEYDRVVARIITRWDPRVLDGPAGSCQQ